MNLVWPACLSEHFIISMAIKALAKTVLYVLACRPLCSSEIVSVAQRLAATIHRGMLRRVPWAVAAIEY
jgi:hypothetical protein